jgi:hypothetical protein
LGSELTVGPRQLFAELGVVVGEFFDPVVSEFESLAPRRVNGLGTSCRQRGTGPLGGLDGFDDVGLGVDPRPSNPSGAGQTGSCDVSVFAAQRASIERRITGEIEA